MRILYAVGSWGLGHATRSLPLIQALLARGAGVTVVSTGRALLLLREELGERCEFVDWPDVPQTLGRSALEFYARSALALPRMVQVMYRERAWTAELVRRRRFDRIVSDNRYGVQHPAVPSFHLAHSLRFIAPGRVGPLEWAMEAFNYRWFRGLRRILVPDTSEDRLSGDLAHRLRIFPPAQLAYVGILSRIRARELPQDLDLFITLSGPEPQRTVLEEILRRQLAAWRPAARGLRVVVALGRPEAPRREEAEGVEVYGYLDGRGQEEMVNRARVVVARSGYSTIMELAEVERQAVLVPTPGQTEQVYLATYHGRRGAVRAVAQSRLALPRDVEAAAACPGLRARQKTEGAVRRAVDLILAGA
ncbi:MAG: glycosyltransferase family protein [Armatimonadota bacterium]|nr:glycosyltransferase family protein [Armatimonadota bacterium]